MIQLKTITAMLVAACSLFASAQSQPTGVLKQDVEKLIQDIKTDVANSQVTPQEVQALADELMTIAATAHKPNPTYVSQLKATAKSVYLSGTVTSAVKALIAKEISMVVASAGISSEEATAVKNDLTAIWSSSNLTKAELSQLLADLKAIVAALPNPPTQP